MSLRAGRVGVRSDQVDSQGRIKKNRPRPQKNEKKGGEKNESKSR